MLMHNIGHLDELWIATRPQSAELARLIVSTSACTHTLAYMQKISNDVE